MEKNKFYVLVTTLVVLFLSACNTETKSTTITSPNKNIAVEFVVSKTGEPMYLVKHKNKKVIDTSFMSFDFKDKPSLKDNFKIKSSSIGNNDETWEMPWGEQLKVRNHYNELIINLEEQSEEKRLLTVHFKVYNDGIGFRYEFPEQANLKEVLITDENTQFNLSGNHNVWWIPGDWDIYEHLYNATKFSEIDALSKRNHPNLNATYIPENAVNTPVTMKTDAGLYLSFHEANLTNYSGMTLKVDTKNMSMTSELVGSELLGGKVKLATPFNTPWRTIQIAEKAGDLIESKLVLN